jgi:acetylornithine deacetylase/succinyl-diaminopimelate desuccinylase-like protein
MVKKRLDNDSIKITVKENMPRTNPSGIDNFFYEKYKEAIQEKHTTATVLPIMLPNVNDLGAFRAKGILGYASIPVYLTRDEVESIHNKNEHINKSSLYDGSDIYLRFLELLQE